MSRHCCCLVIWNFFKKLNFRNWMAGWMKRFNFWNLSNGANGTQSSELWPQRWQIVIKFHWNERRWWTCLSTCLSHPAHSFGAHYHFRLLRIFSTRSCAIFSFVNSCGRQSNSFVWKMESAQVAPSVKRLRQSAVIHPISSANGTHFEILSKFFQN